MTPVYALYFEGVSQGNINLLKATVSIYDTANASFIGRTTFNINLTSDGSVSAYMADVLSQAAAWASTNGWTPIASTSYFATPDSVVASMIAAALALATPYKNYQSIVSQSGTAAPTEVVGSNGFGATTFTWARSSAGVYTITASAATFASGKTAVFLGALNNLNGSFKTVVTSSTVITITTAVQSLAVLGLLGFTATPTDALISGSLLEIRVYP